jgi:hypothetical protein
VTGSRFKNTVFDTRKADYDGFVALGGHGQQRTTLEQPEY